MYSALLQLKISLYIAIKTFIIYVQKRFPFILSKWCSWVDLFEIDSSSGSKVMVQGGPWARLCAHLYVPALCTKGSRAPGGLFLAIQIQGHRTGQTECAYDTGDQLPSAVSGHVALEAPGNQRPLKLDMRLKYSKVNYYFQIAFKKLKIMQRM